MESTKNDNETSVVLVKSESTSPERQISSPLAEYASRSHSNTSFHMPTRATSENISRQSSVPVRVVQTQDVVRQYSNVTENVIRRKKYIEELIEKTIVVPEKIIREEEYDDVEYIKENIIEVARKEIRNVYVDVPVFEHREEIVEVEERRIEEKLVHVDKVEYQEVINYVPRIEQIERVIEVDQIEYIDVDVEKIVEVPEYREEIVIREKPMPRYVEKLIHKQVDVEVKQEVHRIVPRPVEQIVEQEFNLPKIQAVHKKIRVPLYVPRFIEIPVAAEKLTKQSLAEAEALLASIKNVCTMDYPSLCELEELASEARGFQLQIEEDPDKRFANLAGHLDTNVVVVSGEDGSPVIGRKISVSITNHTEL